MIRPTSHEAYEYVRDTGILKRNMFQVYKTIYHQPSITQNECHALMEEKQRMEINKPSVTPMFARLVDVGAIREVGQRICSVTGRNCLVYEITENIPVIIKKTKILSEKEEMMLKIAQLESEIETLKHENHRLKSFATPKGNYQGFLGF